jgi:hypothetical protein
MRKVLTVAAVFAVLTYSYSWVGPLADAQFQPARVARATADVRTFTLAAHAYEVKYGERPATLETLMTPPNGRPAFLEPKKENLIDPWGRPYKYDAKGPHNNGLKPDIWSEGPDPNDKTKVIANWPAAAAPQPSSTEQKLDAILAKLEAIEKRLTELEKRK